MQRVLQGKVVSKSGDKTVGVEVLSVRSHPLYRKRMTRAKKYLVHDEKNAAEIGQEVKIVECRPLSARKRWRIYGS